MRGVPDAHARDVGDRVVGSGGDAPDRHPEIPQPLSRLRIVRRRCHDLPNEVCIAAINRRPACGESSGTIAARTIIRTPMVGSKSNVASNDPVTSRTTPAMTGPSADAA